MQAKIDRTPIQEEPKRIPEEVLRLQSLLLDNGWKMLVERFETEIKRWEETVNKPRPIWLSKEDILVYADDMELIKIKTAAYKEILELPFVMLKEYGNEDFRVQYTKQV